MRWGAGLAVLIGLFLIVCCAAMSGTKRSKLAFLASVIGVSGLSKNKRRLRNE
jgi:hypothetical protein